VLNSLNLDPESFALVTIHRPSNVDSQEGLRLILDLITEMAAAGKVAFPVHPRTRDRMAAFGLLTSFEKVPNLIMVDPLGYFDFQNLIANSKYVLTDSGGIQEETTFLQKPCLTLRPNTERPSTIEMGSNTLLQFDIPAIIEMIQSINDKSYKKGQIPLLWDGNATERVLERIEFFFESGH
jgi:UDP-N-acetylglucosamine 2-epimerase (non-hydrolysing)